MYVDPRVAHGRARFDLSGSPRLVADERRWEISDVVTRGLDDFTGVRNRRNLMRLLERQIAPKLARLGSSRTSACSVMPKGCSSTSRR